jgi:peroxiredoxin
MQTISVGVSLPDQWFLYQDSISVKMSQFTGATRTALCFVDASCDACNSEIESVASLEPAVQLRFIFISHDEPEVLSQRQRAAGLQAPLLYDFGGRYFRALNIQTYPFIVVLDSDRRIIQIHAEYVAKEDLKELVGLGE